MDFPLFSIICFLNSIVLLILALYTWRHRSSAGARMLTVFAISIAIYTVAYGMELASDNLDEALFWSNIEYIGILTFPTLYLIFILQYIGQGDRLTPKRFGLLFTLPLLFFCLKLFDGQLHWIYINPALDTSGPLSLLSFARGPVYVMLVAFNLIVVTVGNYLLFKMRRYSSNLFRKQTSIMLAAALIVYLMFIAYLTNAPLPGALKGIDFNPISYTIWVAIVSMAIFQYQLLDLAPIARDKLIEMLNDGVVVLDIHARIVDANPAALKIFQWPHLPVGEQAHLAMEDWVDKPFLEILESSVKKEIYLTKCDAPICYDVTFSVLSEKSGQKIGYLVLIHDINDRKHFEQELQELTLLDEMTALTNRRGFKVLSEQLLNMANRMQMNAALFYIDIDRLKWINDHLGHAAGDQAIKDTAALLQNTFRTSDIIARLGGDEFVVLAIESNKASADVMMKHLKDDLAKLPPSSRGYKLSISIGMAHYEYRRPILIETLLEQADRSMYKMKQQNNTSPQPSDV